MDEGTPSPYRKVGVFCDKEEGRGKRKKSYPHMLISKIKR